MRPRSRRLGGGRAGGGVATRAGGGVEPREDVFAGSDDGLPSKLLGEGGG